MQNSHVKTDVGGDLQANVRELQELLSAADVLSEPIAVSPAMHQVLLNARRFASSGATVLLTGESGTGKEVVARLIHTSSPRCDQPYVRVNCAALPEALMESELFGHKRGAFTGALETRRGRLASAEGGTILLDEISEIPLGLQAKLLRVLEEEEYQPLGSDQVRRVQARVIATTNRCLLHEIRQGTFRQDLYYRLNILDLEIPPLRERVADIEPLARYFVQILSGKRESKVCAISQDALRWMQAYSWPGNVRQLRNIIHRACVVNETGILSLDEVRCMDAVEASSGDELDSLSLEQVEKEMIFRSLRRHAGNKTAAARDLGVTARTLANKLKRYAEEPSARAA